MNIIILKKLHLNKNDIINMDLMKYINFNLDLEDYEINKNEENIKLIKESLENYKQINGNFTNKIFLGYDIFNSNIFIWNKNNNYNINKINLTSFNSKTFLLNSLNYKKIAIFNNNLFLFYLSDNYIKYDKYDLNFNKYKNDSKFNILFDNKKNSIKIEKNGYLFLINIYENSYLKDIYIFDQNNLFQINKKLNQSLFNLKAKKLKISNNSNDIYILTIYNQLYLGSLKYENNNYFFKDFKLKKDDVKKFNIYEEDGEKYWSIISLNNDIYYCYNLICDKNKLNDELKKNLIDIELINFKNYGIFNFKKIGYENKSNIIIYDNIKKIFYMIKFYENNFLFYYYNNDLYLILNKKSFLNFFKVKFKFKLILKKNENMKINLLYKFKLVETFEFLFYDKKYSLLYKENFNLSFENIKNYYNFFKIPILMNDLSIDNNINKNYYLNFNNFILNKFDRFCNLELPLKIIINNDYFYTICLSTYDNFSVFYKFKLISNNIDQNIDFYLINKIKLENFKFNKDIEFYVYDKWVIIKNSINNFNFLYNNKIIKFLNVSVDFNCKFNIKYIICFNNKTYLNHILEYYQTKIKVKEIIKKDLINIIDIIIYNLNHYLILFNKINNKKYLLKFNKNNNKLIEINKNLNNNILFFCFNNEFYFFIDNKFKIGFYLNDFLINYDNFFNDINKIIKIECFYSLNLVGIIFKNNSKKIIFALINLNLNYFKRIIKFIYLKDDKYDINISKLNDFQLLILLNNFNKIFSFIYFINGPYLILNKNLIYNNIFIKNNNNFINLKFNNTLSFLTNKFKKDEFKTFKFEFTFNSIDLEKENIFNLNNHHYKLIQINLKNDVIIQDRINKINEYIFNKKYNYLISKNIIVLNHSNHIKFLINSFDEYIFENNKLYKVNIKENIYNCIKLSNDNCIICETNLINKKIIICEEIYVKIYLNIYFMPTNLKLILINNKFSGLFFLNKLKNTLYYLINTNFKIVEEYTVFYSQVKNKIDFKFTEINEIYIKNYEVLIDRNNIVILILKVDSNFLFNYLININDKILIKNNNIIIKDNDQINNFACKNINILTCIFEGKYSFYQNNLIKLENSNSYKLENIFIYNKINLDFIKNYNRDFKINILKNYFYLEENYNNSFRLFFYKFNNKNLFSSFNYFMSDNFLNFHIIDNNETLRLNIIKKMNENIILENYSLQNFIAITKNNSKFRLLIIELKLLNQNGYISKFLTFQIDTFFYKLIYVLIACIFIFLLIVHLIFIFSKKRKIKRI